MESKFKVIAPLVAGILFMLFSSVLLIVGNFQSDWPVAVIPIIIGSFFIALSTNNKKKLHQN